MISTPIITKQGGGALVMGLMLLSLITLLGLAGASAARVELQLAHNEQFRENAASAASAGIEMAIRHVTVSAPESVPARLYATLPDGVSHCEMQIRLLGHESGLPQLPGASIAAAHYEILSTGHAPRGAVDRQRARVSRTVELSGVAGADCEPVAPGVPCSSAGSLRRLSWQRLANP
jgi:hypothetical protein